MSLLMQALKKAERNQRDALPDDDQPALPSEMYDSVLAPAPDDAPSSRVPPAQELSLEPLEFQYEADAPGGVGEAIPALQPATPAPHDPTPPQSRRKAEPKRKTPLRPGSAARPAAGKLYAGRQELLLEDVPAAPPTISSDGAGLPSGAPAATNAPLSLMPLDAPDTPPAEAAPAFTAAPAAEAGATHDALAAATVTAHGDMPSAGPAARADTQSGVGTPATDAAGHAGAQGDTHRAARVAGADATYAGLAMDTGAPAGGTRPGGTAHGEPAAYAHETQSASSGSAAQAGRATTAHGAQSSNPGNPPPGSAAPAESAAYTHGRQSAIRDNVRPGSTTAAESAGNMYGQQSAYPGNVQLGGAMPAEPTASMHGLQSANPGNARFGSAAPAEPGAYTHGQHAANPGNLRPGSTAPADASANMPGQQSANPGNIRPGSTAPADAAANVLGQQSANPGNVRHDSTAPAEATANMPGQQSASAHGAQSANAGNGKPPGRGGAPGRGPGRNSAGAAARARAAAKAAAEQDRPGRDPARVRLAVLGGVLALVAGTLAGVYWYALTSPGPGAKLPPVPMPPPGAPTGPAAIVVAPPAGQPDSLAPPAPDAAQAAQAAAIAANAPHIVPQQPSPHSGSRMPSDDDLQRALQQPGPAAASAAAQTPASQLPRNELPPGYVAPPNTAPVTPTTPATSVPPATPPAATDIHVARNTMPQRVNPALQEGYQAFMAGDLVTAAQSYASALRQDPNNRDALLGSAAVAARRNDTATATAGYTRLLELNPSDSDAQAGLLALRPGDSSQNELRLKELLRREPGSGPLEFALGNLYAQQGRWPDAQQAYFRAYTATPENADYAFNLAVGLDQLNQRKLALTYYQRALDLSRSAPAVFDRNTARRRADQITASLPPQAQPQAQPQTRPITQAVPAPGSASAPPAAKPPLPAAIAPPAPPPPPPDSATAASAVSQAADGAPPGRAGNNGRQP